MKDFQALTFAREAILSLKWCLLLLVFLLCIASISNGQANVPTKSVQCSGLSKNGQRCTRKTKNTSGLCFQHDKSSKYNSNKQAKIKTK